MTVTRKLGRAIEVVNQEAGTVCPLMRPMSGDGVVLCGDWCAWQIRGELGRICAMLGVVEALRLLQR